MISTPRPIPSSLARRRSFASFPLRALPPPIEAFSAPILVSAQQAAPAYYNDGAQMDIPESTKIQEVADYAILPHSNAGRPLPPGDRAPVLLIKALFEQYFGMPLAQASKELVSFFVVLFPACCVLFRSFTSCSRLLALREFSPYFLNRASVQPPLGILKRPFRDRLMSAKLFAEQQRAESTAASPPPGAVQRSQQSTPLWSKVLCGQASSLLVATDAAIVDSDPSSPMYDSDIHSASCTPVGRSM